MFLRFVAAFAGLLFLTTTAARQDGRCWQAKIADFPECYGYRDAGYTCVNGLCAAMNPRGEPVQCAKPTPNGHFVDHATGTCRSPADNKPVTRVMLTPRQKLETLAGNVAKKAHFKATSSLKVDNAKRLKLAKAKRGNIRLPRLASTIHRKGQCWQAKLSDFPRCSGYRDVGYTCVNGLCAGVDPGGDPTDCAVKKPPDYVVDHATGTCQLPAVMTATRLSPPVTTTVAPTAQIDDTVTDSGANAPIEPNDSATTAVPVDNVATTDVVPHPLSEAELEAIEREAMAEAIAEPRVGKNGEDRTNPADRGATGAGRKDIVHPAIRSAFKPFHTAPPDSPAVADQSTSANAAPTMAATSLPRKNGTAVVVGRVGPGWTRGEIEPPAENRDMGEWQARVYSAEQRSRLSVDKMGNEAEPVAVAKVAGDLIAIGDVHGCFECLRATLRANSVTDTAGHWVAGKRTVVQLGDLIGRGTQDAEVITYVQQLQAEAAIAGGEWVQLIGNHEQMQLDGDFRYGNDGPGRGFESKAARARAFTPSGWVGQWLGGLPVIHKWRDVVFVHGGLTSLDVAQLGVDSINWWYRAGSTKIADEVLWSRSLPLGDDPTVCTVLDQVLDALGAQTMVVGHTITSTAGFAPGELGQRCGGKLRLVDVGMSDAFPTIPKKHRAAHFFIGAAGDAVAAPSEFAPGPQLH